MVAHSRAMYSQPAKPNYTVLYENAVSPANRVFTPTAGNWCCPFERYVGPRWSEGDPRHNIPNLVRYTPRALRPGYQGLVMAREEEEETSPDSEETEEESHHSREHARPPQGTQCSHIFVPVESLLAKPEPPSPHFPITELRHLTPAPNDEFQIVPTINDDEDSLARGNYGTIDNKHNHFPVQKGRCLCWMGTQHPRSTHKNTPLSFRAKLEKHKRLEGSNVPEEDSPEESKRRSPAGSEERDAPEMDGSESPPGSPPREPPREKKKPRKSHKTLARLTPVSPQPRVAPPLRRSQRSSHMVISRGAVDPGDFRHFEEMSPAEDPFENISGKAVSPVPGQHGHAHPAAFSHGHHSGPGPHSQPHSHGKPDRNSQLETFDHGGHRDQQEKHRGHQEDKHKFPELHFPEPGQHRGTGQHPHGRFNRPRQSQEAKSQDPSSETKPKHEEIPNKSYETRGENPQMGSKFLGAGQTSLKSAPESQQVGTHQSQKGGQATHGSGQKNPFEQFQHQKQNEHHGAFSLGSRFEDSKKMPGGQASFRHPSEAKPVQDTRGKHETEHGLGHHKRGNEVIQAPHFHSSQTTVLPHTSVLDHTTPHGGFNQEGHHPLSHNSDKYTFQHQSETYEETKNVPTSMGVVGHERPKVSWKRKPGDHYGTITIKYPSGQAFLLRIPEEILKQSSQPGSFPLGKAVPIIVPLFVALVGLLLFFHV